jgi:hypothetical protein
MLREHSAHEVQLTLYGAENVDYATASPPAELANAEPSVEVCPFHQHYSRASSGGAVRRQISAEITEKSNADNYLPISQSLLS